MDNSKPFRIGDWWYSETSNSNNDFILERLSCGDKSKERHPKIACKLSASVINRFYGLQIGFNGKIAVSILHSELDSSYELNLIALETATLLTTVNTAGSDVCLSPDDSWLYYLSLDRDGSPKELRKRRTAFPFLDVNLKTLSVGKWATIDVLPSRRFLFLHEGDSTFLIHTDGHLADSPQLCSRNVNGLRKVQDVSAKGNTYFIGYGNDGEDQQYIIVVNGEKSLLIPQAWKYVHVSVKGIITDYAIFNDEILLVIRTGGDENIIWTTWMSVINEPGEVKWKMVATEPSVHHTSLFLVQAFSPQHCQMMVDVCCPACKVSSYAYIGKGIVDWHKGLDRHHQMIEPNHYIRFLTPLSYDNAKIPVTLICPKNTRETPLNNTVVVLLVYGAYGKNLDPTYDSSIQYLVSRGMHIAYAHVRGGGELGTEWHHAGQRGNKQNAINDYISVSISIKHECAGDDVHIIAAGASAGGAIAAAALNQRPDLYDAAYLVAPFISPLKAVLNDRNPRLAIDQEEFGRTQYPREIEYLRSWSPLENVAHQSYPPICIAVNKLDTNVNNSDIYLYARKIRAAGGRIFISTREQATHTFVLPSKDIFDEINWLLNFQHDT